jgi:hypothetical protein
MRELLPAKKCRLKRRAIVWVDLRKTSFVLLLLLDEWQLAMLWHLITDQSGNTIAN